MDADILRSADYRGTLTDSIVAGLSRWAVAQGMASGGQETSLSHLGISFTDDVREGMELDGSDVGEGPESWWRDYGGNPDALRIRILSNGRETTECPPFGAFALRSFGQWDIVALRPWIEYLRRAVGPGVAADVVGITNQAVEFIGGLSPAWCEEQVDSYEEWYDDGMLKDDIEDGNRYETYMDYFEAKIPKYARSYTCNLARLRRRVRDFSVPERSEEPSAPVLRAALKLAEVLEARQKWYSRLPKETAHDISTGHTHYFDRFIPPVFLAWQGGNAADDICLRFYDDHGNHIQSCNHSDVCWIQCFDFEKPGDENTLGTLPHAIAGLKRIIEIVQPLDYLLTYLGEQAPAVPSRSPRRNSRRANAARLINVFGAGPTEEVQKGSTLCGF